MRLTKKLLSLLNRAFDKDPQRFLAVRLRYDGAMTWSVQDARLTTVVSGGTGGPLSIDLTAYTLGELANLLRVQPGYSVVYADSSELSLLSARTLIDGTSSQDVSNGDHLNAYTSVLWAFMEAQAVELDRAAGQVTQMLRQMSTKTAEDVWLDELGSFYGVLRTQGEPDALYGPRIISEVIRPRSNNIALELAIKDFTGQDAVVRDVVLFGAAAPLHDEAIDYDGANLHNATALPRYGLFDVEYGYDLINGGDFASFQASVVELISRLRAAGTHLRALLLRGGTIEDDFTAPADGPNLQALLGGLAQVEDFTAPTQEFASMTGGLTALADTLTAPDDPLLITVAYGYTYGGARVHDGSFSHQGETSPTEPV